MTTTTTEFDIKIHDIVRLANGHQFIITGINPKRPVNLFSGVLVNGQGAEYKFGPKHRPVVIGHAPANHPALISLTVRKGTRPVGQDAAAIVCHLLEAVEIGDLPKAKILAAAIRTMDMFRSHKSTTVQSGGDMVKSDEFKNAK